MPMKSSARMPKNTNTSAGTATLMSTDITMITTTTRVMSITTIMRKGGIG